MDRKLIIDFLEEYKNFYPEMIERELKVEISKRFIVSIIGPRRAGKTYYLLYLRKMFSSPLYLNFEDSRLINLEARDLREIIRIYNEIYGKFPDILLLDEIQNLKNWEIILRELHDLKKYNIVITGSSSKLLSKEIATQLRGRTLSYLLLPFSFREFLRAKNFEIKRYYSLDEISNIKKLLREYLEYGGFPDVVFSSLKEKILKEYSELVLFKDFIERHRIENISLAKILLNFIIQNFAKEISINSLYNKLRGLGFKTARDTVYRYISKLEDTAFFFFLNKYSLKAHLRESYPKKIYLCDTGLVKALKFSEEIGRLMENVVFLEFLRKKNEKPLMEIYYFKTSQGLEVDFLVKEGEKIKELIQVTYASSFDEIDKREWRNLIKASELLKCDNLTIITWDYEDKRELSYFGIKKTINFIPLWKWLLNPCFDF